MTNYIYKCPSCGATGYDIIYMCCQSNRVYVTENLLTGERTYECDDVEDCQFCGCNICGADVGWPPIDDYMIEVDENEIKDV